MLTDISKILKVEGASLEVDFNDNLINIDDLYEDIVIKETIEFKGNIKSLKGRLNLRGSFKFNYSTKCARCAEDINKTVIVDIDESFVDEKDLTDEELYTYSGNFIEFDKVLKDNIIVNLPLKDVCKKNCRGICKSCGRNLNKQECVCKDSFENEKFSILKDFFKNND